MLTWRLKSSVTSRFSSARLAAIFCCSCSTQPKQNVSQLGDHCYAVLRLIVLCCAGCAVLCYAVQCCATPHCAVVCQVMPCCAMLCCTVQLYTMPCHAVLCCAMLHCAVVSHAMTRYAVLIVLRCAAIWGSTQQAADRLQLVQSQSRTEQSSLFNVPTPLKCGECACMNGSLTWRPLASSNFSLVKSSMCCCSAVKLLALAGNVPLATLSARDVWEPIPGHHRISASHSKSKGYLNSAYQSEGYDSSRGIQWRCAGGKSEGAQGGGGGGVSARSKGGKEHGQGECELEGVHGFSNE